jgi:hypothetical protein
MSRKKVTSLEGQEMCPKEGPIRACFCLYPGGTAVLDYVFASLRS